MIPKLIVLAMRRCSGVTAPGSPPKTRAAVRAWIVITSYSIHYTKLYDSLGHAGFFALGAYASAILTSTYGWPPAGALLAGACGTGLLAYAVARPIMKLSGHYLAMGTLGLGIIISIV